QVSDNGVTGVVNMAKDQLKAMAPYTYRGPSWRGHVFSDRGLWTDARRAAADDRTTTDNAAAVNRDRAMADNRAAVTTTATGVFNASGDISANAVIGAKIRNANRDTVGSVQDLYVDASGAI